MGLLRRRPAILSLGSRRVDLVLVREGDQRRDDEAGILHGLWHLLGKHTLVEFKSPSRGFRNGDLIQFHSYAGEYLSTRIDEFNDPSELSLVLIVPRMTKTLSREIEWFRLTIEPLEPGYARLVGSRYTMYVVCLDKVSQQEHDLLPFAHATITEREVAYRTLAWLIEVANMVDIHNQEELNKLLKKFAELFGPQIIRHFTPEQLLAGLTPEQLLVGLTPEQLARLRDAIQRELDNA